MCEAHAYVLKNNREEKILESVDLVEFEDDQINLINIFGEQKSIRARLSSYDSREGKIIFEPVK